MARRVDWFRSRRGVFYVPAPEPSGRRSEQGSHRSLVRRVKPAMLNPWASATLMMPGDRSSIPRHARRGIQAMRKSRGHEPTVSVQLDRFALADGRNRLSAREPSASDALRDACGHNRFDSLACPQVCSITMRRPQFTLRALLVAMLVVAAFFAGMAVQRRLGERNRSAAVFDFDGDGELDIQLSPGK